MDDREKPARGPVLTTFAVLFALLALSNLLKPLQLEGPETGLVLFGIRLTGTANTILGPLFGLFLALFAYGIWNMRRYALPISHFYATYVALNLAMWSMIATRPPGLAYQIFAIVYAAVAIGVSVATAVALTRRKEELT